jgi:hypothetical protein
MNCHKLPSLPGLNFDERLKRNHHVSHSFYYQNGYRIDRQPSVGIGKEPIQETYKDFYSEPVEYVYKHKNTHRVHYDDEDDDCYGNIFFYFFILQLSDMIQH